MWRNDTKCKYMFMFPLKNLARKGLSHCSLFEDQALVDLKWIAETWLVAGCQDIHGNLSNGCLVPCPFLQKIPKGKGIISALCSDTMHLKFMSILQGADKFTYHGLWCHMFVTKKGAIFKVMDTFVRQKILLFSLTYSATSKIVSCWDKLNHQTTSTCFPWTIKNYLVPHKSLFVFRKSDDIY